MNENVVVNLDALASWKTEMNCINTSSIEVIQNVRNILQEMDEEWKGNSATAFLETFDEKINEVLLIHEKMQQIENMFTVVADTTSMQ